MPISVSPDVPEWGTVQDAADRMRVSSKTIRRYISQGLISADRFGPRLIRVDLAKLGTAARPLSTPGAPE